ncbi:SecDF P1 head subdomain-containing protein [Kutzneria albida]|uniref:SecDF P1 head subdomain domain-containing protein n=1 Tax=Kutzneria albida DSM 43870 TaxID=1449976 RepID=W5WGA0_9PSEU|nr:hypothetical protein [Kutzneria albida]AHH99892.1 hypothetical protein KALB_6533 [Kutzneria albida DSM 43870]
MIHEPRHRADRSWPILVPVTILGAIALFCGVATQFVLTTRTTPTPAETTLVFRPVVEDSAAVQRSAQSTVDRQAAGLTARALEDLDCSRLRPLPGKEDPRKPLLTCDHARQTRYLLGPAFLDASGIQSARATFESEQGSWVVWLTFTPEGARTWSDYTGTHVGGQVAFTLDGEVVSAPRINQPIAGDTQVSGSFTEQAARQLAEALTRN